MKSIRYVASLSLLTVSALAAACGGGIEVPTATQAPEGTATIAAEVTAEPPDRVGGDGLVGIVNATTNDMSNEADIAGVPIVRDGNLTYVSLTSQTPYLEGNVAWYSGFFSLTPQKSGWLSTFQLDGVKIPKNAEFNAHIGMYPFDLDTGELVDTIRIFDGRLKPGPKDSHLFDAGISMPLGFEYVVHVHVYPVDPQKDSPPTFKGKLYYPNPTLDGLSDYNLRRVDRDILVPDIDTTPYEKFSKISTQRYVDFGVTDVKSSEVPALFPITFIIQER